MKPDDIVSAHTKSATRELARTWGGGKPTVHQHWDKPEENWVGIASRADCPWDGVTAYGTLGLSEHSLGFDNDLRVEIIGACAASTDLSNVLATCAFNVIKDAWQMRPGAIHNDVLRMYDLSRTLAHVMFVPPFLWDDGPETLHLEGGQSRGSWLFPSLNRNCCTPNVLAQISLTPSLKISGSIFSTSIACR